MGAMRRIDVTYGIVPEGKPLEHVLREVVEKLNEVLVLASHLNNEAIEQADRIQQLESQLQATRQLRRP